MRRVSYLNCALILLAFVADASGQGFPKFKAQEIDANVGKVCYALTHADVNGDRRQDIVALTEDALLWYENPSWTRHEIIRGKTARDNVCVVSGDIDRDRKVDFVIGAGWKPSDTETAGTLQWVGRDADGNWQVHPINFEEPSLHRMTWASVPPGRGRRLIVAPLQGRGTKGPDWGAGNPVKILSYSIPEDPSSPEWPVEVLDESLHTVHNLHVNTFDQDRIPEIFLASWEGVFALQKTGENEPWRKVQVGTGNQQTSPFKGASEVRTGWLGSNSRYVATIEPWHGSQVVVYTPDMSGGSLIKSIEKGPWNRRVIAEPVSWGHAVICFEMDGDPDEELIIGQRDANPDGVTPKGPGVLIFDPVPDGPGKFKFVRHVVDDGGMACEDLFVLDLDANGNPDIVAGGRATHNIKIYWNLGGVNSFTSPDP